MPYMTASARQPTSKSTAQAEIFPWEGSRGSTQLFSKSSGVAQPPIFSRFNSRKWKNFEGHGEGDAASPTKGCLRLWQRVSRTLLSLAQEFAAHFSHQISWRYDLRNKSLAFVHNNPFAHHANMKKKQQITYCFVQHSIITSVDKTADWHPNH